MLVCGERGYGNGPTHYVIQQYHLASMAARLTSELLVSCSERVGWQAGSWGTVPSSGEVQLSVHWDQIILS